MMMSPKGLVVFSLIILTWVNALGQRKISDSLEARLPDLQGYEKVDVLNRLTYEFIAVENTKVLLYNSQALALSKKTRYRKGEGLAYTYRGIYEYQTGQFKEARTDLHRALKIAREVGDRANEGYTLLQLGNSGLEEVNMDSSFIYFRKAYHILRDSSNPENLSKLYRNMSALYGQRFQPDSQQFYLDRAIRIRRLLPDQSLLVDALAIQANNKLSTGDLKSAETLLDEASQILTKYPDDLENLNDVKHIRALVLFQKGEFEEATVLFDSARNYYFRMSLFRKYVTLLTDIGKIFSDRGEYELALNNLYSALQLSNLKEFETETYIIRNRIGWINYHLGDLDQALRLADESLKLRPKKLLTADLANALTLKGVALLDLHRYSEARVALEAVLALQEASNPQGVSEALLNLGALEAQLKNYSSALQLYEKSIRLAEDANYVFGLAWSNWGIGDIYFRKGEFARAQLYLDRSEVLSRRIHANELLIHTYDTKRDLLAATGKFEESLKFSIMSGQLKDSVRRSDLSRRFANLEKIQEIEQRDRDIKVLRQEKELADEKINLQESRLRQQYILIVASIIIITLLAFLALIYYRFYSRIKSLNVTITEKNKSIEVQASELKKVNAELQRLYNEVSEQNEEIQLQADELARSNESITDLNRGLERLIAEKTVELRSANDELVKHNNELLQFSYTVSHNLRGPVARILGLSTLMSAEQDISQARQWVDLIGKTTFELDLIIKDLGKILKLRNEPHHLRDLVSLEQEWNQSLSLLQDSLTGTEKINYDFTRLPEITTVKPMLQSVFYNLLSNSLKFRSQDRPLLISATSRLHDGKAEIVVTDTGLGFDTKLYKDKLFRLYTRFHSHVEGRGLGLYLVKSQLEVLNGTVEVESVLGQGTAFRILLPLAIEETIITG
jgi:signal transduction histidine kinase